MPDMNMCQNAKCPFKATCYRWLATPSKPYQWFHDYQFTEEGCEGYWPMETRSPQKVNPINENKKTA